MVPSYYVMAAAVISFIVIARMPETAHPRSIERCRRAQAIVSANSIKSIV